MQINQITDTEVTLTLSRKELIEVRESLAERILIARSVGDSEGMKVLGAMHKKVASFILATVIRETENLI